MSVAPKWQVEENILSGAEEALTSSPPLQGNQAQSSYALTLTIRGSCSHEDGALRWQELELPEKRQDCWEQWSHQQRVFPHHRVTQIHTHTSPLPSCLPKT